MNSQQWSRLALQRATLSLVWAAVWLTAAATAWAAFLIVSFAITSSQALAGGVPTQASGHAEAHLLADEVAAHALKSSDILGLISAAKIKLDHPDGIWPVKKTVTRQNKLPAGVVAAEKPLPAIHPRSGAALLATALQLATAAKRQDLIELIKDVQTARPRGMEGAPKSHTQTSLAGATDVYRELFKGGELATVVVSGTGESNLDLYVFDESNKRICASERLEDLEVCRWQPDARSAYTIHVVNRGKWNNQYLLRSN